MPDIAILAPPIEELLMDLIDSFPEDNGPVNNVVPENRDATKFVRVEIAGIGQRNKVEFDCRMIIHLYNFDDAEAELGARTLSARLVASKQTSFAGWWIAWAEQDSAIVRNTDPEVEGLFRYQFMTCLRIKGKAL
jgi:hypothetical protein